MGVPLIDMEKLLITNIRTKPIKELKFSSSFRQINKEVATLMYGHDRFRRKIGNQQDVMEYFKFLRTNGIKRFDRFSKLLNRKTKDFASILGKEFSSAPKGKIKESERKFLKGLNQLRVPFWKVRKIIFQETVIADDNDLNQTGTPLKESQGYGGIMDLCDLRASSQRIPNSIPHFTPKRTRRQHAEIWGYEHDRSAARVFKELEGQFEQRQRGEPFTLPIIALLPLIQRHRQNKYNEYKWKIPETFEDILSMYREPEKWEYKNR